MQHTNKNKVNKIDRFKCRYRTKAYKGPPPTLETDPKAWFHFSDRDEDSLISQEEIITVICYELVPKSRYERAFIRDKIQKAWPDFDPYCHIRLGMGMFLRSGLVEFLIKLKRDFRVKFKREIPTSFNSFETRERKNPPPLSNPKGWFEYFDADNSECLSRKEVVNGLIWTLKPNSQERLVIIEVVERLWNVFDNDYSGSIDKWEFLKNDGMANALIRMEHEWKSSVENRSVHYCMTLQSQGSRRYTYMPPPEFSDDPDLWFKHFDIDNSGTLSQREAMHGLYVTLNAVSSEQRKAIRKHVLSWPWEAHHEIDLATFVSQIAPNALDFIDAHSAVYPSTPNDTESYFNMKVYIPNESIPGDITKVCSPQSQETILVLIPRKETWCGGNGEPLYFVFNFFC